MCLCILLTAASGGWQEPENPHTQRVSSCLMAILLSSVNHMSSHHANWVFNKYVLQ